jgi:hypothetical protein
MLRSPYQLEILGISLIFLSVSPRYHLSSHFDTIGPAVIIFQNRRKMSGLISTRLLEVPAKLNDPAEYGGVFFEFVVLKVLRITKILRAVCNPSTTATNMLPIGNQFFPRFKIIL